jgi:hypothetical protein
VPNYFFLADLLLLRYAFIRLYIASGIKVSTVEYRHMTAKNWIGGLVPPCQYNNNVAVT